MPAVHNARRVTSFIGSVNAASSVECALKRRKPKKRSVFVLCELRGKSLQRSLSCKPLRTVINPQPLSVLADDGAKLSNFERNIGNRNDATPAQVMASLPRSIRLRADQCLRKALCARLRPRG